MRGKINCTLEYIVLTRAQSTLTQVKIDCTLWLYTRENEVREHTPVPYDNLFQSILSHASRRQSYF